MIPPSASSGLRYLLVFSCELGLALPLAGRRRLGRLRVHRQTGNEKPGRKAHNNSQRGGQQQTILHEISPRAGATAISGELVKLNRNLQPIQQVLTKGNGNTSNLHPGRHMDRHLVPVWPAQQHLHRQERRNVCGRL